MQGAPTPVWLPVTDHARPAPTGAYLASVLVPASLSVPHERPFSFLWGHPVCAQADVTTKSAAQRSLRKPARHVIPAPAQQRKNQVS